MENLSSVQSEVCDGRMLLEMGGSYLENNVGWKSGLKSEGG